MSADHPAHPTEAVIPLFCFVVLPQERKLYCNKQDWLLCKTETKRKEDF